MEVQVQYTLGRAPQPPETRVKRPFTITILALVLYWLSIGGIGLAILAPALARLSVPWGLYRAAGLAYAVTAMITATGLWRLAPWSYSAFIVWAGVAIAAGTLPALTLSNADVPWWVVPAGVALFAALFVAIARYIRRAVPAPALQAHAAGGV
jgi:hypothetical protein